MLARTARDKDAQRAEPQQEKDRKPSARDRDKPQTPIPVIGALLVLMRVDAPGNTGVLCHIPIIYAKKNAHGITHERFSSSGVRGSMRACLARFFMPGAYHTSATRVSPTSTRGTQSRSPAIISLTGKSLGATPRRSINSSLGRGAPCHTGAMLT